MKKLMMLAVMAIASASVAMAQSGTGFPEVPSDPAAVPIVDCRSTHSRESGGTVRHRRSIRIAPVEEKEEQRLIANLISLCQKGGGQTAHPLFGLFLVRFEVNDILSIGHFPVMPLVRKAQV